VILKNGRRRIVASKKAPLDRIVILCIGGKQETDSVRSWIEKDPIALYYHIYEPRQHNLIPISLTSDGIALLKKELELHHPDLYFKIAYKKRNTKG
jgi:hypothetical protein